MVIYTINGFTLTILTHLSYIIIDLKRGRLRVILSDQRPLLDLGLPLEVIAYIHQN